MVVGKNARTQEEYKKTRKIRAMSIIVSEHGDHQDYMFACVRVCVYLRAGVSEYLSTTPILRALWTKKSAAAKETDPPVGRQCCCVIEQSQSVQLLSVCVCGREGD